MRYIFHTENEVNEWAWNAESFEAICIIEAMCKYVFCKLWIISLWTKYGIVLNGFSNEITQ